MGNQSGRGGPALTTSSGDSLNLTNNERVKVHDFIEAIMRMKRPVQGLDVAVAKSLMRRLILEVEDLATNSVRCQDCFRGVAEKLREVEVVDAAEAEAEVSTTESRITRVTTMTTMTTQSSLLSPKPSTPTLPTSPKSPASPKEHSRKRAQTYHDDLLRRNRALELKIAAINAFVNHAKAAAKEDEDEGVAAARSSVAEDGEGGGTTPPRRGSIRQRASLVEIPRPRSCSPGWD
eukprot:symbB.v1.2.017254.t1/scaffold1346.1/size178581/7